MTVTLSPENYKKFQALRTVLGIMKNDGNSTAKSVSQNEVMSYLFLHVPIMKDVEEYMKKTDKMTREISEQREELIAKGGL